METYVAKTVGVENEEGRNNDVESMKQDISKYFYQIENTLAGLKDMSQVSEIRDKMKYVAENIKSGILDLGDIMPPSTKVKLLRTKSINEEQSVDKLRISVDKSKIKLILNPVADGNCGFRCVAHAIHKNQDEYMLLKEKC
ncbi:unnamed protein product [Rhizopus stolonifer]